MTFNSYGLPYTTMITLMKMIDNQQLTIVDRPKRNEASAIQRFVKDYIEYKRSK